MSQCERREDRLSNAPEIVAVTGTVAVSLKELIKSLSVSAPCVTCLTCGVTFQRRVARVELRSPGVTSSNLPALPSSRLHTVELTDLRNREIEKSRCEETCRVFKTFSRNILLSLRFLPRYIDRYTHQIDCTCCMILP